MNTRHFAVLLGAALVLNVSFSPLVAAFTDIRSGSQLETYVNDLSAKGIISGYPDGSFRPTQTINRAEALKIIFETVGISADADGNSGFPDVPTAEWYAKYVKKAKDGSIVAGYPDGRFRPQQEVNRAEFVKMALSALPNFAELPLRKDPALRQFTDLDAGQWYVPYLGTTVAMELVALTEKFRPTAPMSRQDAVEIIYRVSKYLENPFVPEIAADASSSSTTPATFSSPEEAALSEEGAFVMDPVEIYDPDLPLMYRDLRADQLKVVYRPGTTEVYFYLNGYNLEIKRDVRASSNQATPEVLRIHDVAESACGIELHANPYREDIGTNREEVIAYWKADYEGLGYMIPIEQVIRNEYLQASNRFGVKYDQHIGSLLFEGESEPTYTDNVYYFFTGSKYYTLISYHNSNEPECAAFTAAVIDGFSFR